MLPRPVRHQVRVVGGGGVGHGPGTPTVEVTQVIRQYFQLISREVTIIPQDLVVTRPACSLNTLVTKQVEITLSWMINPLVHHRPSQGVAVLVLLIVGRKEPCVMPFLDNDVGD